MPSDKPKCPSCEVEIEGTPDSCAKCGFNLKDFPSFFSFFKTAAKQLKREEDAAKAADEAEKKKKTPPSVMDSLLGKKRG
jgi:hypothetical protein